MIAVRLWANRHARAFEWIYKQLEGVLTALDPVLAKVGYGRIERPVAFVERQVKGLLFDCQMCGQCVLSSTGMSCPMNCPKQLRNGPCGGVRPGGFCEIKPEMPCVWVLAWDGAAKMAGHERINIVLPPVDRSLQGSSAWLRASRERAAAKRGDGTAGPARAAMAATFPAAARAEPTSTPKATEPERRA